MLMNASQMEESALMYSKNLSEIKQNIAKENIQNETHNNNNMNVFVDLIG